MAGNQPQVEEEQENRSDLRLGQVLIDLGMLTEKQLDQALRVAQQLGLPVGRVLVMYEYVPERHLHAAVQVQSLLKDELMNLHTARHLASVIINNEEITFEEALAAVDWKRPKTSGTNKLGELLLAAGFVNQKQLEDALLKSKSSGVPFGRLLVLNSILSEALLASALNAQILVRDGKITREQAVQGLIAARERQIVVELPLIESGYYRLPAKHTIRLGELLVLAGLMSESDLMYAVEVGLINRKPIGQVLVELQYISKEVLDEALRLQGEIISGAVPPMMAAHKLTELHHKGSSEGKEPPAVPDFDEIPEVTVSLSQFLSLVGVVNDDDIRKAIEIGVDNPHILGRMLLLAGVIDEHTLKSALRCYSLIREGILGTEQGFIAFNYSQQSGISVDDALQELGVVSGGQL